MNNILPILTILISIISIFISYRLGLKTIERKKEIDDERDNNLRIIEDKRIEKKRLIESKKDIYNKLYIPLIKLLIVDNEYSIYDYRQIVIEPYRNEGKTDQFLKIITQNIDIIPSEIINEFKGYGYHTKEAMKFSIDKDRFKEVSYNYSAKIFDNILNILLKNGSEMAKELGFPNHFNIIIKQHHQNKFNSKQYKNYADEIYENR